MAVLFVARYQHLRDSYNERTRAQMVVLTAEWLFGQHGFWKPMEGIACIQNSEKWGVIECLDRAPNVGLYPIELYFGLAILVRLLLLVNPLADAG